MTRLEDAIRAMVQDDQATVTDVFETPEPVTLDESEAWSVGTAGVRHACEAWGIDFEELERYGQAHTGMAIPLFERLQQILPGMALGPALMAMWFDGVRLGLTIAAQEPDGG